MTVIRKGCALLLLCVSAGLAQPAAASLQPGTYFAGYYTSFSGTRYYQGYVPTSYTGAPMPLVVALHGCTETAAGFELLTRWDDLAEQRGFILVLPEQSGYANGSRCWNWFLSSNQSRGSGEPAIIAGITQWVRNQWAVDARRIHVTGASAGAAMSVIMGATYPDLYASIGAHSGCEYKGAPCGWNGGPDPVGIGNQIYTAMGSHRRVLPVIAFVGSADSVAAPINTEQIIVSFAQANDRISDGIDDDNIDGVPDQVIAGQVPGGRSYTRYVYADSRTGGTVLEKYVVDGMGHAWSGGCGCSVYGDPSGPDATAIMFDFFAAHPKP